MQAQKVGVVTQQDVERRRRIREQGNRIASANDRAVLVLSSAGLAASFAFVRFLGTDVAGLGALQSTWVCWFLSTACLIVSFQIGMLGSWMRERTDRRGPSGANIWIRWLNFGSGLFYLAGLCAFVVFLFMNTPGGDGMPRDGEDFYGIESDAGLEKRSELIHDLDDLPKPDVDTPTGDGGGHGGDGGGASGGSTEE